MEAFLFSGAILSCDQSRIRVAWGEPRRSAIPGAASEASVFAPDFFLKDEAPWRIYPHSAEISSEELRRGLGSRASVSSWSRSGPDPGSFLGSFERLQTRIAYGELRKGVPVVFEAHSGAPTGEQIAGMILAAIAAAEHGGRVYGAWEKGQGILGLTPEDLFVLTPEGALETMALAGTARLDCAENLPGDSKERHEHQLVIEDLVERLSPLGQVSVGETCVVRLPALAHLKTGISVRPKGGVPEFAECVRRLHPTAALGAFPREAGWKWLLSEDSRAPHSRNRFGAPFGWLQERDRICAVAIRNIQWSDGLTLLGSGCGVVAQSDADKEWAELELKRASVRRALGMGDA